MIWSFFNLQRTVSSFIAKWSLRFHRKQFTSIHKTVKSQLCVHVGRKANIKSFQEIKWSLSKGCAHFRPHTSRFVVQIVDLIQSFALLWIFYVPIISLWGNTQSRDGTWLHIAHKNIECIGRSSFKVMLF